MQKMLHHVEEAEEGSVHIEEVANLANLWYLHSGLLTEGYSISMAATNLDIF